VGLSKILQWSTVKDSVLHLDDKWVYLRIYETKYFMLKSRGPYGSEGQPHDRIDEIVEFVRSSPHRNTSIAFAGVTASILLPRVVFALPCSTPNIIHADSLPIFWIGGK